MNTPAPAIRSLKRQAAADRLTTAGLKLLAGRPLSQVKVADITRQAGMSKGAFFSHFQSKDAFAAHLLTKVLDELAQRVRPVGLSPDSAEDLMAGAAAVHLRFFQVRPEAAALLTGARELTGEAGQAARQRVDEHLAMVGRLLHPALAALGQPVEQGRELALAMLTAGCGLFWLAPWLGTAADIPAARLEQLARSLARGMAARGAAPDAGRGPGTP